MQAGLDDKDTLAFNYYVAETFIVTVINATFEVEVVSKPFEQMTVIGSL